MYKMVILNMNISKFLGKVIGLYMLIVTVAMLLNMHQFTNKVDLLINDIPLMFGNRSGGVFYLVTAIESLRSNGRN